MFRDGNGGSPSSSSTSIVSAMSAEHDCTEEQTSFRKPLQNNGACDRDDIVGGIQSFDCLDAIQKHTMPLCSCPHSIFIKPCNNFNSKRKNPHRYTKRQKLQHRNRTISMRQQRTNNNCLLLSRSWGVKNTSKQILTLLSILQIMTLTSTTILSTNTISTATAQPTEDNKMNNPQNKFCGISYDEAHQYCHLPPHKSLPCPNGEEDCPYNMPCWEILDVCTYPPTTSPSLAPTSSAPTDSPITGRSSYPGDHHFCGLGFDNLFGW